ncbi:MAG: tetratricopeptide repeat protein [Verrucomicrobiota bacterium]
MTSVVTFVVQKQTGSLATGETIPLGARAGNALISYCRYLGKLFWPVDLAVFYPHPGYWPAGKVVLAGGLLLGITAVLIVLRGRYPFMLMGWLWYGGMLVPMIGLVQTGEQAMADRHGYIPSLGVLILVIWGAYGLTRGWRHQVLALSAAGSVAMILCAGLTRQQLGYWEDSETLFRHALACTSDNAAAHNNLGAALLQKGNVDEAVAHFEKALQIRPGFAQAHNNLANILVQKDMLDEAIAHYQKALQIHPDYAEVHNNLGNALLQKGSADEAITHYQMALQTKPDSAQVHYNLGGALLQKGSVDEAIAQFQKALQINPDFLEVLNNLAWLLATCPDGHIRDGVQAVKYAEHACELTHHDVTIFVGTLAAAYAEAGRFEDAIAAAQQACALASAAGEKDSLEKNQKLLALYRAHQPYHEAVEKIIPAAP